MATRRRSGLLQFHGTKAVIDYYEASGFGLITTSARNEKPYIYGPHIPPHDARCARLGTGKDAAFKLTVLGAGLRTSSWTACRWTTLYPGNGFAAFFRRRGLTQAKCAKGLRHCGNQRGRDEKARRFRPRPMGQPLADAFRYLVIGCRPQAARPAPRRRSTDGPPNGRRFRHPPSNVLSDWRALSKWREAAETEYAFTDGRRVDRDEKAKLEETAASPWCSNGFRVIIASVSGSGDQQPHRGPVHPREIGDAKPNEILTAGAEWFRDEANAEDEGNAGISRTC